MASMERSSGGRPPPTSTAFCAGKSRVTCQCSCRRIPIVDQSESRQGAWAPNSRQAARTRHPKEIDHERASCTGAAGSWFQHRGSCVLFGPGPRSHASVGLRPSLKASAWRGRRLRTAQKGTKRHAQHEAARAQEPGRFYRIGVLEASPVPPSKAAVLPENHIRA